jgi:hypothetical protein
MNLAMDRLATEHAASVPRFHRLPIRSAHGGAYEDAMASVEWQASSGIAAKSIGPTFNTDSRMRLLGLAWENRSSRLRGHELSRRSAKAGNTPRSQSGLGNCECKGVSEASRIGSHLSFPLVREPRASESRYTQREYSDEAAIFNKQCGQGTLQEWAPACVDARSERTPMSTLPT